MPDYHDVFWKLILSRVHCTIEFLRFLLKEKAEFLDLENLRIVEEIIFRKKKLMYDILFLYLNGRIRWVSIFGEFLYYETV